MRRLLALALLAAAAVAPSASAQSCFSYHNDPLQGQFDVLATYYCLRDDLS